VANAGLGHRRDSFVNVNDPEERRRVEALLATREDAR
jgi:hypothetical protein